MKHLDESWRVYKTALSWYAGSEDTALRDGSSPRASVWEPPARLPQQSARRMSSAVLWPL